MYTIDDRTNLTNKYNDEAFAIALDTYTSDSESAYLNNSENTVTTMHIVRNLVPLLDRKNMNEFMELWAEYDFCDIYDYFFYKSADDTLYIIFAFKKWADELMFFDFEVDEYSATFHQWKVKSASQFVMVKA